MYQPDFIVIGSQRAGTTWLHNCLNEHPDVFVPAEKELHYFDLNYDQGADWYANKFTCPEATLSGEITPNYYQYPNALERIKADCPNAKLIYILREPISRAISQFDLFKQQESFKNINFEQALDNHPVIMDLSLQGKHLKRLYNLFDTEQILVLFYDDLHTNPHAFLQKVLKFLQLDTDFSPSFLNKKVNKVAFPKAQALLSQLGLSWAIELVKKSPFSERIKRLGESNKSMIKTNPLPPEHAHRLAEDIRLIEQLLGKDLSVWRSKVTVK